nr:hypothetical protein [Tanacetum cinerariifolium]
KLLTDGASWSIEVDTGEPIGSAGLGAAVTGTRETTLEGGFKNLLNIGNQRHGDKINLVSYRASAHMEFCYNRDV